MFNKRKKARELQQINEARIKHEGQIDAAIEEAGRVEDPAKKILELQNVRQLINVEVWRENNIIFKKTDKSFSRVAIGGTAIAIAGATGATIATLATGGVGAVIIIPLFIGGLFAGLKRSDSVEKKLKAEVDGHMRKTESQLDRVTDMMQAEVESKFEAISQSPLKDKVLSVPGISGPFSEAAAKHFAAIKEEPAKEAAPPAKVVKRPRPKPGTGYDGIINATTLK